MTDLPRTHELVSLDGEITDAGDARLRAVSSLALAGKGAFTTAAFFKKEVFQWDRHVERLLFHARIIGVDTSGLQKSEIERTVGSLLERCGEPEGKLRITVFDPGAPKLWPVAEGAAKTRVLVQTGALPKRSSASLGVSPFPVNSRSPLAGVKSCNYLEPLMSAEEGRKRGFEECLRLNEAGVVVSGCLSNVFWRSGNDGRWKTPPLSVGCLEGTTRAYVMESVEVDEAEISLEELVSDAVSVFLTSSVIGILPAVSLEGAGPLEPPGLQVQALFGHYPAA